MNNLSPRPFEPFVFIFLMAYSMHNDLSRRIQELLLRITLNNTAALCVTSEMKWMAFFKPYRLEMNWKRCVLSSHLTVWPLSFYVQITLLRPSTLIEIDKLTDGLVKQCGCRSEQVLRDLNRLKCRVTLLRMHWPSSSWSILYLYIPKVSFLLN